MNSLDGLEESVSKLERAIHKWAEDSEKAAQIIESMATKLQEIREYAEGQYDGPEDKRMSRILAICGR